MARHVHKLACLLVLFAVNTSQKEQTRWSRQISSYTADITDWVPLAAPIQREPSKPKHQSTPIKRQAIAEPRILTEPFPGFTRPTGFNQETFPSRNYFNAPANRQLYLQSVPSAPQNYLTDQGFGQGIRFGLSQPNFPLNQAFVAPQYTFDNAPSIKTRPPPPSTNPVKFESFPNQNIAPAPQTKPFANQAPKSKSEVPQFIDGYRVDNITNDYGFNSKKKAQSLQKLKFENADNFPKTEIIPSKPKVEREEVQLLYVPLESLNRGQFNFRSPVSSPQIVNTDLYSQGLPKNDPLKPNFASDFQRPISKPVNNFGVVQDYFPHFDTLKTYDQVPKFTTLSTPFPTLPQTTPKSKKLKPHQPPLAIFQEAQKNSQIKVGDVLSSLKNANTIAVLDSVNPLNAPKVFIGPSTLTPPENYVKFELPYLSNIENSDKKLRQLPFFVAPLSYNTPQGFAKIPFPSPHVGSVVINSLIKEHSPPAHTVPQKQTTQHTYSTPTIRPTPPAQIISNSYTNSPSFKQDIKPVTHKPNFNYYSTASPKTNPPLNQHSNYYSFEPQTVTSISPLNQPELDNSAPQKGTYFLSNIGSQYNPSQYVSFPSQNNYRNPEPVKPHKPETTTTVRTTTTTTTAKPSTYSSQLLETHNPYSINQAFHFSTPLDYHSYFDEFKDPYAPPEPSLDLPKSSPVPVSSTPISTPKSKEIGTEKPKQQTSPSYLQNYTPEIHYESEVHNSRYPVYDNKDYTTKSASTSEPYLTSKAVSADDIKSTGYQTQVPQYNNNLDFQHTAFENLTETINNKITAPSSDVDSTKQYYNQYETNYNSEENIRTTSSTSTTSTTTTRRTPIRNRGRPRYTTAKTESNESATRTTVTRRPIKERRPLPTRPKYETNKVAEKTTKKSIDSNESTTKSTSRTRSRGRIQYKPTGSDEYYDRRNKLHSSKEDDLAYQRDILHQNYPVTLMERMSTVDIEAITEPTSPKLSSTKTLDNLSQTYDTENAYAHESPAISHIDNSELRGEIPNYSSKVQSEYEDISVPKYSSTRHEEYYQSRSSAAPAPATNFNDDSHEKQVDYSHQTTPVFGPEKPDVISFATESIASTEQSNYSIDKEHSLPKQEDLTTIQDIEITKVDSQETNYESEPEENNVQTTPSYNRVRVRPGVIRQYHQASSTETSRTKSDRKRPVQAVTYRPAFDRRRTTMRIDEIEADLKTKQVHSRPEVQDYRHPVYKPDHSTEPSTTLSTSESTVKRGHFRRRRPTYSTTSTEAPSTKKIYEVKNRFRGRRPTEKPSEKPEVQTEQSSTIRNTLHSRYSNRPRLSERYNKKPEPEAEEISDQDSNYSINRPKYLTPESEQWSPKISSESFKPYNPNDIIDETKIATTERRSDKLNEAELDIITAKNDYDDILISVTPASNNRVNKKIPDIPPTLEALVEQRKTTKSDSSDTMSTFETMLEEVMKSLEEQDENEYTSNVMKHKGGEIGEIPPERIISSGEDNLGKLTTQQQEVTSAEPVNDDSSNIEQEQIDRKSRRRGFWKKVKVRPLSTESIDVAESQYYPNTVNRLGESVKLSNAVHEKSENYEKPKYSVTTYKPTFQFIKDMFENDDESAADANSFLDIDIPKIDKKEEAEKSAITSDKSTEEEYEVTQNAENETTSVKPTSVGDEDLGTGSPDPTLIDNMYQSTPTEPTASESMLGILKKSDSFSLMDYLFGTTSSDDDKESIERNETATDNLKLTTKSDNIERNTEQTKAKLSTTESTYIPEEITAVPSAEENTESISEYEGTKKVTDDDQNDKSETTEASIVGSLLTSSISSFMNPANILSTSMSTEVSHETEICFRGKCIKTSKNIL